MFSLLSLYREVLVIFITVSFLGSFNGTVDLAEFCNIPEKRSTNWTCTQQSIFCGESAVLVCPWKEIWHKEFASWNFNSFLLPILPVDSFFRSPAFVPGAVFSKTKPTPLKGRTLLIAVSSEVLSDLLDLEPLTTERQDFIDFACGNIVLPGSVPLAHRYGGHQFGSWANQLGDGRVILLGEYMNEHGERWELQLKGSGKTPYSRAGDGRAVLRSSIREFLACEAMFHLGVPTSRAASIVVSEEVAYRDQFYNGQMKKERTAVVLRLAPSWFRFGSLEILAKSGEVIELKQLVDFILKHHFADWISSKENYTEDDYIIFYRTVVRQTAELIAKWQSVGFSHGVCNTDNFSILSVTIDYGPFGFLDVYNPDFVPNYSDDEGRYSYKNQPNVGYFNLDKLRKALIPLVQASKSEQRLSEELGRYWSYFDHFYREIFGQKFGISHQHAGIPRLINTFLTILDETRSDFTASFRQLGGLAFGRPVTSNAWALKKASSSSLWTNFLDQYNTVISDTRTREVDRVKMINATNPVYILRNWMAQQAILAADNNDFSEVHDLHEVLRRPFHEQVSAEKRGFSREAPAWSKHLKVSCSS